MTLQKILCSRQKTTDTITHLNAKATENKHRTPQRRDVFTTEWSLGISVHTKLKTQLK